jgi:glyoxylase-like metal-dependent hydrolase (beta-lactamase superfamily II)
MEIPQDSFQFNIGHLECLVINDGKVEVTDTGPAVDFNCLLIKMGKEVVLVDTGLGFDEQPQAGKLLQNLKAAGIQCTDINTVILSHGHGDHICGNTDAESRPAFPNARYVMDKIEWEFWTSDPDLSQLNLDEDLRQNFIGAVRKNLLSIKERFLLIDGETEISPGIRAIRTPGHTPGHIILIISSGSEQLIALGDLFHGPVYIEQPDLFSDFDFALEQARQKRAEMLSHGIFTSKLIFACHFPFPGLGYIVPNNNAWLWQPIETK